jgi:hypothetical protein
MLAATAFRKDGGVRQQDVADNKYLASQRTEGVGEPDERPE